MEVEIIRRLITVTTAKQSFRAGVVITFWQDIQIESSCRMLYSLKIRKWGRTFYTNFRISGITDTTARYNIGIAYLMLNYLICNSLHLLVNVHMYWAPVHCNLNLASRSFNHGCGLLRHWSQTLFWLSPLLGCVAYKNVTFQLFYYVLRSLNLVLESWWCWGGQQ